MTDSTTAHARDALVEKVKELRDLSSAGRVCTRDNLLTLADAIPVSELRRIKTMVERAAEAPRDDWGTGVADQYQPMASCYCLNDLTPQPFHDTADLPWVAKLEANCDAIRDELHACLADRAAVDGKLRTFNGEAFGDWKALLLNRAFREDTELLAKLPVTRALIDESPVALEATISMLEPHTELKVHVDSYPMTLTYHLPLVVDEASVTVAGIEHEVETGRSLLFDHSFLHSAANRSDARRIHLIFNVWHPALTQPEVTLLKMILPAVDDYLEDAGIDI